MEAFNTFDSHTMTFSMTLVYTLLWKMLYLWYLWYRDIFSPLHSTCPVYRSQFSFEWLSGKEREHFEIWFGFQPMREA